MCSSQVFRADFFILVFIEHLLCDKVQGLGSSARTLGLFLPCRKSPNGRN